MIQPRNLLLLSFLLCGTILRASDPLPQPSFIERIMNPDRNQRSSFQGKMFESGGGNFTKSFTTTEYAGVKEFQSKSFLTKTFEGAKKSWIGKLFPEKKLPENFKEANPDANKQFASKDLPKKNYVDLDKKSRLSTNDVFSTRASTMKGAAQEALDNDPNLQAAVKKGLSVDDIRKLLNKPQ
jgi:hypothetical protein